MAESFFDRINKSKTLHTPDVLSCLANLSNDEVFTPPDVVNKMLDVLPQELFENPNTTFLDPCCKTGVFLREIAKRLLVGLERKIPDLQQRIDHICHKQLYGIAITELTSLLSRRSVYCSKSPDGRYSVSRFSSPDGNIRFKRIKHTWVNGRCKYCGANMQQYERGDDLETYAYEFIHSDNVEKLFNMKFDVIIGNPPYQLSSTDIEGKANAMPIYHLFVEQAKKLNPSYIVMIIPSRWMTGGSKALDEFRHLMIHDQRISIIHDYLDSKCVFSGVDIKGGVCYFLWDKTHSGKCQFYTHNETEINIASRLLSEENGEFLIRNNKLISIKNKVSQKNEPTVDTIASPQTPYGFLSNAFIKTERLFSNTKEKGCIYRVIGLGKGFKREIKYLLPNIPLLKDYDSSSFKVFIPEVYGNGSMGEMPPQPIIGLPNDICTQTFRQFGGFKNLIEAENFCNYIKTKFFRLLVGMLKYTHHAPAKVYQFVPLQDFSKPWTDEELYAKYGLSQEEIDFIESMIRPMDGGNE